MDCLSSEQLTQLALGVEREAEVVPHLQQCDSCRAIIEQVQSLNDQLAKAHDNLHRGHDTSRAQLLENLPSINKKTTPAKGWCRISSWFGELNMKQRIALSGMSMVMVFGLVAVWLAITTQPVSAMEKMGESISKMNSYKVKMTTEIKIVRKPGKKPQIIKMSAKLYWQAPGSIRVESSHNKLHIIAIHPAGKKGITILPETKTFQHSSARQGQNSPLMVLEGLSKYSGKADRKLGTKKINGRKVLGFEIESKKIDPDTDIGLIEIWLDAETNLPAEINIKVNKEQTMRLVDFEWHAKLDSKLFDATPPQDYKDTTPKPISLEKKVRSMSESLKLYAELSGGHYPRVKMIYGDLTRDKMKKMAGIKGHPTPDNLKDKKFMKIMQATLGFGMLNMILRDNPDAVYYGRTVGPKDKDKVLLHWKLDDGKYHVMYGDLRAKTMTAQKLKALENK